MALSGLFVLAVAGAMVILAILGLIALFSRGQALPAIIGIVLFGCLILGVGGAVAYLFLARTSTVVVRQKETERQEATRQELRRIGNELHAQQPQLLETDSQPTELTIKPKIDEDSGEGNTKPADKPTEPDRGEP
jgi:gas vesicle protein